MNNYKGIEANHIQHGSKVLRVTKHVEKLLEDENYSKASLILQTFNEQYPKKNWNSEKLEKFIDDLLKENKSGKKKLTPAKNATF